jgi:hypothetical protein
LFENKIMFKSLITICKNIQVSPRPQPPLGRWATDNSQKSVIKSILANHDCCGDRLCGDPLNVKEQVDKVFVGKQDKN